MFCLSIGNIGVEVQIRSDVRVRNEAEREIWFRARLRSESRNETDDRLAEKVIFNPTIRHLDHFVASEENRSINWVFTIEAVRLIVGRTRTQPSCTF
jgi:hypothetical protein